MITEFLTICKLVTVVMILVVRLSDPDVTQPFFRRHKILAGVLVTMTAIGLFSVVLTASSYL